MTLPALVRNDPWLEPFTGEIIRRIENASTKKAELVQTGSLTDFASGHLYYGLHKETNNWVLREWAPNATKIYLKGNFNGWREDEKFAFRSVGSGNWELQVPLNELAHGDCGLSDNSSTGDWRLPNLRELHSLINYNYTSAALSNSTGLVKHAQDDPFISVKSI